MLNQKIRLIICLVCCAVSIMAQDAIYMAPDGVDSNEGTIDYPVQSLATARDKARVAGASRIWIRGGRYPLTQPCTLSSEDNGLAIAAYANEDVVFDGGVAINGFGFKLVEDEELLSRLHANARGKVYSQIITDELAIARLSLSYAQMSLNDAMITKARFPNVGYAHAYESTVDKSSEENRAIGTDMDPKGGSFMVRDKDADFAMWQKEISRTHNVWTQGYPSAVWKPETLGIAWISSKGVLQLKDGSSYGLMNGVKQLRFYTVNMLCELDMPGEWYFDSKDHRLYLWTENHPSDNIITAWAGCQFLIINGEDISLENVMVENIVTDNTGTGILEINGKRNLIAGVTLKNMFNVAFRLNGQNNTMKSSDVFDCLAGIMSGGSYNADQVIHGNNTVENCHFTRIHAKNMHAKIAAINGAGNTFRNNLVHNTYGQPITYRGVDHDISRNEIFNVGVEEGDGGALYTGGNMWEYGSKIYENFTHHVMDVVGLNLGRAAFFQDDYSGGNEIYNNVFFKAGSWALKMNKGSGMYYHGNFVLDTKIALKAYARTSTSTNEYNTCMDFISNKDFYGGDKSNYISRMLRAIGKTGWEQNVTAENWDSWLSDFWKDRYPYFGDAMHTYNASNSLYPVEVRLYNNYFFNNSKNVESSVGINASDPNIQLDNLTAFEDPSVLDFSYTESAPSSYPAIDFDHIALYKDDYRCQVPDKDVYRAKIKEFFKDRASHVSGSYNYETVNEMTYYNSGEMVLSTVTCGLHEVMSASLSVKQNAIEGSQDFVCQLTLNKPNNTGAAISFGLDDLYTGSAEASSDYEPLPEDAKIIVPEGANVGTYTISVKSDDLAEFNETIDLQVHNPSNAFVTIRQGQVQAVILDDDAYQASILATRHGSEDSPTHMRFNVHLNKINTSSERIVIPIRSGEMSTATADKDYVAIVTDAVVEIPVGQLSADVVVDVIDDANFETTETLYVALGTPANASVLIKDTSAFATISDDDVVEAMLTATDALENDPLGLALTVTLSERNESGEDIHFSVSDLDNGLALSELDYDPLKSYDEIVVPMDSISGTFYITLLDDDDKEPAEDINIEVATENTRVYLSESTITAMILDDETAAALSSRAFNDYFIAYPNPVEDLLYFEAKSDMESATVELRNLSGILVLVSDLSTDHIDVSHLSSGVYSLKIFNNSRVLNTLVIKK